MKENTVDSRNGLPSPACRYPVPSMVEARALAAEEIGKKWLAELDSVVEGLEKRWSIRVGRVMPGGSHALVALASGADGCEYVLKVDFPEGEIEDYMHEIRALQAVDGCGYVKVYACDPEKRACLLERLGKRLKELDYSVEKQMQIICTTLMDTWQAASENPGLSDGYGSIAWFRDYISQTWEELGRPCSETVIRQAMRFLDSRKDNMDPDSWVLVHGDAHNNNTLQVPGAEESFKLIDPDGIFYEKAYDLGVLMREWPEEYRADPLTSGRKRARFLQEITGVDMQGIWEWGFLQMVSTSLVLLQIGQKPLAEEMLSIAQSWCSDE